MRWLATVFLVIVASARMAAQSSWYDLPVPPAALAIIDVDVEQSRALALLRGVRVLHSSVRNPDALPAPVLRLEQVLMDLERFETEAARLGSRPLSLAMAKTNTERDGLKDLFDVVGVRLRERKKVYSAELEKDKEAVELRRRLETVGLDIDAAVKRLNAGEAITLTPLVVSMPSPLPLEVWSKVIFERPVPARSVFGSIVRDRNAALLLYGLTAMTPPTRTFLASHAELLQHLYRDVPGPVAAFGGAFRVDADGRVVVPGGAEARELWEALADERLDQPEKFGRRLFDKDNGRLAYFLDTVDRLDRPHQAFAIGLWLEDRGLRAERFKALYRAFADIEPEWTINDRPFSKPLYDPGALCAAVHVGPRGEPVGPAFRKFWSEALDSIDIPGSEFRMKDVVEDGIVDAAWLAEHMSAELPGERRARLERLLFAQRVFSTAPVSALDHVLVAVHGFGRFPALMATLEQMGIHEPDTYAAAARHARAIEDVESANRAIPLLTQFQGALALVARGARNGAFDPEAATALVTALSGLPVSGDGYQGRVMQWVDTALRNRLPGSAADALEARVLRSMADRAEPASAFEWEGATYLPDLTGHSMTRLADVRAKQGGNTLDNLTAVWREAAALQAPAITLADIKTRTSALRTAGGRLVAARPWPDWPDDQPEVKKVLDKAVKNLSGITKPKDATKAAREAEPVIDLVDLLLGETLTALAYAPAVGDPSKLLGPASDVSHRHSFGLIVKPGAAIVSRRTAWQRPTYDSADGAGQGLKGSLFAVDLALAKTQLRRLVVDKLPSPRLNPNNSAVFVETLALTNPAHLVTADLTRVGQAVVQGRARVVTAGAEAEALDGLADAAAMRNQRRQLLQWAARETPARVADLFSVSELFWLGGGGAGVEARLAAWGTSSEPLDGCYCKGFPASGAWDWLSGRPGGTQLATAVADLNLRLAEHLAALKLPASLFAPVLAMATQDFIDNAPPIYDDDWLGIVAFAGQVTQEGVEDYVAAVVASGPVRDGTAAGESGATK